MTKYNRLKKNASKRSSRKMDVSKRQCAPRRIISGDMLRSKSYKPFLRPSNETLLKDAAMIIAVFDDPKVSLGRHEKDTSSLLEHMVLAATTLGYSKCWKDAFDEDSAKQMFDFHKSENSGALAIG